MQSQLGNLEERVRALEAFVATFKSTFQTLPSSGGGEGPKRAAAAAAAAFGIVPKTWAIKRLNATEQQNMSAYDELNLPNILPSDWKQTSKPEEAALLIFTAFTAGGRVDVSSVTGFAKPGQKIVGVVLHAGKTPVRWPIESSPVDASFSFALADNFQEIAKSGETNEVKRDFQRWLRVTIDPRIQIRAPYICFVCGDAMEQRKGCSLGCKTLYCGQACANQHWEQGHWEQHSEK